MKNYPSIIFDAERMKYIHTGLYHYCQQLGNALLRNQHEFTNELGFYLPFNALDTFGENVYKLKQSSYDKFFMPSLKSHKVWHCTYQGTNYYPIKGNHKVILTIHDLNFLYEKSLFKQKKYLRILQQKVDRADSIVAVSNFVKNEITNNLSIGNKQIDVIYNGCNIPENIIYTKPTLLNIDFPFIFTIGAITPKKNFHTLPASIKNNECHLVIAGLIQDKEYFAKIMVEAKRLGVEKRVHYIGSVTEQEKYWLYKHCSLFIFPSIAEGFGLPVVEAMRFGRPILLSKFTSLPEIGGKYAFYLDNFSVEEVETKANYAVDLHSLTLELESIEWSKKFNWDDSSRSYWKIYEDLCK